MVRLVEVVRAAAPAVRKRFAAFTSQSERSILLETVLVISAVSVATGLVFVRAYSTDVLSSLLVSVPEDCFLDWEMRIGQHCFSDYAWVVSYGMRPNPWDPYPLYFRSGFQRGYNNYAAAGMAPQVIFGFLGRWLHAPRLGLLGYLAVLTISALSPAIWATRGARGLERAVVLVALGAAAVPAWMVIDRGNSLGFVVPVALLFLVALCRRRWRLATIMVVLAALIKPQFVVLAVALFAGRQWRLGGLAIAGAVLSNLAVYALWPRDFPTTILQSIRNAVGYGSSFPSTIGVGNMSFAKTLLTIPDDIKSYQAFKSGGTVPESFLAGPRTLIGYAILFLVVVSLVAIGRRIPPVMAGIVLLATASLFAPLVAPYYLVFVLPVAALVARNPDGPLGYGIFDEFASRGDHRRAVGICVSLAAALSIAQSVQVSAPFPAQVAGQMGAGGIVGTTPLLVTSVIFAPGLWLIACAAIIVSYARKPAPAYRGDTRPDPWSDQGTAANGSPRAATSSH